MTDNIFVRLGKWNERKGERKNFDSKKLLLPKNYISRIGMKFLIRVFQWDLNPELDPRYYRYKRTNILLFELIAYDTILLNHC